MIGITVSTNYSDLLPYVLEANERYFKEWYVITSPLDEETINILKKHEKVTILYYNFNIDNRKFDKGGAVQYAQHIAYCKYPKEWYLIVDSDICIESNFSDYVDAVNLLDAETIYGAQDRRDYYKLSDYRQRKNYFKYGRVMDEAGTLWGDHLAGYFQLYKKHFYYYPSYDASGCDVRFLHHFKKHKIITDLTLNHLGKDHINWKGRKKNSDFIIDIV
jgi:hypothetical protein